jgi:7-keto-8-aminopelargonate synthetase-like enzyme
MNDEKSLVLTGPVGSRTRFGDVEYLYFGGTNYLGFANRPELQQGAIEAVRRYGTSFSASRETSGTGLLHLELERKLAMFKGKEDACIYASGYLGNQILLSALAEEDDVLLCDAWAHPSIREAIPSWAREVRLFRHHDTSDLAAKLKGVRKAIIALDGVDSGTGDIAPLPEILDLIPGNGIRILVDDCHGTAVLGPNGRGTPEHFGLDAENIYQTETMSKALGSFGGFMASSKKVCDRIRRVSTTYIGSTPLPPPVLGASLAAVELAMREKGLREQLRDNARYAAEKLTALGLYTPFTGAPVLSIRGMAEQKAKRIHETLKDRGILVPFVHYPRPEAPGRLRMVVMATHTHEDIDRLCDGIKQAIA